METVAESRDENGDWKPAEPLPFLGVGVDWEVYSNAMPMRAVGYIGYLSVAEVKARNKFVLWVKMLATGWKHRKTTQAPPFTEGCER